MYLTADELKATYYKKAALMDADDVTTFLGRANAYALGVIGGVFPAAAYTEELPAEGLKNAVSLAFEIFSKGQTGASDPITGNITEEGPAGLYVRQTDPLNTVKAMLKPYTEEYDRRNTAKAERSVRFL